MLKRTVVILAAAAFLWVAVPTQTAQARGYYDYYDDDDEFWDLMNPGWWYDEMFDDDDDWRYYRHHPYNPYWGGPYGWGSPYGWGGPYGGRPPVIVIEQQPDPQNPETRLPR